MVELDSANYVISIIGDRVSSGTSTSLVYDFLNLL